MNEEQTDEALKADESQIDVESPATEEVPTPVEGEEVIETPTEAEVTEGAPKDEGRKTANSRIRELVSERKEAEARAESLADQVKRMTAPQPTPYVPTPESAENEITVEEVLRRSDALTQIRLAQQENIHRVHNESLDAIKAYPELDPESESFDPELSESISQATLAHINSNPTAPVKEFVSKLMRPYRRAVEKQVAGQAETLTKQVSQQAMRPTQVNEQEKPFEDLSLAEMEKVLGVVSR